ncbi:hypothetical protein E4K67_16820 [Desulfosporosinus fructosivorans]|uniref:Metal-binding protein n=1 Tax=Desulfosporosinus fructosivorans TaxID=2018669 RepID=A0A4Z0R455_9FIRM|nr:DUF2103 domain-containing protein [Desulfosporosinus fructosivorans]TGE36777.1 hypothetical protein E4K67_16820 [Desulfosporosinus fructosivorans]
MKYRRNKVKREHGIIQNALLWLENLGRLSEVTDIIPGVIDVSHSSERGIVYKYETQTGCKLLLKSNGSIQEVFVVTKDPICVQNWVKREFPPDLPSTEPEVITKSTLRATPKKQLTNLPKELNHRYKKRTSPRGLHHSKKRTCEKGKGPKHILGDQDSPNVADCLDRTTLKALSHLKKFLEYDKIQNAQTMRETFQQK